MPHNGCGGAKRRPAETARCGGGGGWWRRRRGRQGLHLDLAEVVVGGVVARLDANPQDRVVGRIEREVIEDRDVDLAVGVDGDASLEPAVSMPSM